MTINTPIERRVARVAYYLRNIACDLAPQFAFRRQRNAILERGVEYDVATLAQRLNYYNKLSVPVDATPFRATVGSIPMKKSIYYYDLKEHARYFPRSLKLNFAFGDVTDVPERPSFVKSRPIVGDNRNSVLMKLEKFRHFYFPPDRTAFHDKKSMAVWRGGIHNKKRMALLARQRDPLLCDIGQTAGRAALEMRKKFLTPTEQMNFRYIISIEGNDVASNLKWILASNSLCLMPKPVYETWFMEGRLEARRHYVELRDDFDDLEEKVLYYESHVNEALEIIANANAYVRQFFDERREQLLALLVMEKYFAITGQIEEDPRLAALIAPA
jgi:Glycosyl transferase family 90